MSVLCERPWLVTGAAGFLGSHVVEELLDQGMRVVAVDKLSSGRAGHLQPFLGRPGFALAVEDIRNVAGMIAVFKQWRPAVVVHLAALHFIPAAVADPALTLNINVQGTQAVLSACRAAAVEHVWFASTGDVYAPAEGAHAEDGPLAPFNIYGVSKWMGEQLIALEAGFQRQGRFVIGRLLNLYGPGETTPHFIPEILRHFRERPEQSLCLGSLWPRRDLVPVRDAARAILATMHRAPLGVTALNIATGVAWSMQQVVELISELLEWRVQLQIDPAKIRPFERKHLQADVTRLQNLIGWTPHANLRRGLEELLSIEGIIGAGEPRGSANRR
jgi:UDP-glucose 4-epimerase